MRIFETTSRLCVRSTPQHANRRTRPSGPEFPKNQLSCAAQVVPMACRKSPQLLSLTTARHQLPGSGRSLKTSTHRGRGSSSLSGISSLSARPTVVQRGPTWPRLRSRPDRESKSSVPPSHPTPSRLETDPATHHPLDRKIDKVSLITIMYIGSFTHFTCSSVRS